MQHLRIISACLTMYIGAASTQWMQKSTTIAQNQHANSVPPFALNFHHGKWAPCTSITCCVDTCARATRLSAFALLLGTLLHCVNTLNLEGIHLCHCMIRHSVACKPQRPTLLVGGVQRSEAIVLDPLKLGLGDRLQLGGGGTAHLPEEGYQVPLPMVTEGIPHTLHCQLLQQPPDYS